MAILLDTLVIQVKILETVNLFFQTFPKNTINDWELVRSYIELEFLLLVQTVCYSTEDAVKVEEKV
jgi:hypothetical protein